MDYTNMMDDSTFPTSDIKIDRKKIQERNFLESSLLEIEEIKDTAVRPWTNKEVLKIDLSNTEENYRESTAITFGDTVDKLNNMFKGRATFGGWCRKHERLRNPDGSTSLGTCVRYSIMMDWY